MICMEELEQGDGPLLRRLLLGDDLERAADHRELFFIRGGLAVAVAGAGHGGVVAIEIGGDFQQLVPRFEEVVLCDLGGSEHRLSNHNWVGFGASP
jgi:hypothetical protein